MLIDKDQGFTKLGGGGGREGKVDTGNISLRKGGKVLMGQY